MRAEVIFPDAAQRALYEELPVKTFHGDRVYSFTLRPQPGMEPDRHFHIVTVAVALAGELSDNGPPGQTLGPNGAMWEDIVRTQDGRYELRLSEGMLLPSSVRIPDLDLHRAAEALSQRYAELTAHQ